MAWTIDTSQWLNRRFLINITLMNAKVRRNVNKTPSSILKCDDECKAWENITFLFYPSQFCWYTWPTHDKYFILIIIDCQTWRAWYFVCDWSSLFPCTVNSERVQFSGFVCQRSKEEMSDAHLKGFCSDLLYDWYLLANLIKISLFWVTFRRN